MAHSQKPDFVFRRNGPSPFKSAEGVSSVNYWHRGERISGSNAGYTMFRGSVKGTGYPLYSSVSPSTFPPCVTVCHHISTGLYCSVLCNCCMKLEGDKVLSFPLYQNTPLDVEAANQPWCWIVTLIALTFMSHSIMIDL